jgi:hypothetical protein
VSDSKGDRNAGVSPEKRPNKLIRPEKCIANAVIKESVESTTNVFEIERISF